MVNMSKENAGAKSSTSLMTGLQKANVSDIKSQDGWSVTIMTIVLLLLNRYFKVQNFGIFKEHSCGENLYILPQNLFTSRKSLVNC